MLDKLRKACTPEPQSMSTIDELEIRSLERVAAFSKTGGAYAPDHATCPSTICLSTSMQSNCLIVVDRPKNS
jgi:hypothetical protein